MQKEAISLPMSEIKEGGMIEVAEPEQVGASNKLLVKFIITTFRYY